MRYVVLLILALFTLKAFAQQTFYNTNAIQKIEIFFNQPNWSDLLDTLKATNDGYLTADSVKINGTLFPTVSVKFKGNSSYDPTFNKNPFTIKLSKIISQNYQNYTDIKLSNCYKDPSMLREVLSYDIANKYMESSKCNFAQVYVNNVLQGLYSNVEDVTEPFCASHFRSTSTNTLIKGNPMITPGVAVKSNLKYISADSSDYFDYYELKSAKGWNELVNLCDIASNNPTALNTVLDIDRMIWMLAYNNLLINLDSYSGAFAQNYYLFKDNNGIFNTIPWDLNMSLGGFPFVGSSNTSLGSLTVTDQKNLTPFIHQNDIYWPVIKAILANESYKRMYIAHMRTIKNEIFESGYYDNLAQQLRALVDTAVVSDTYKFHTYAEFQNSLNTDISVGTYNVPGLSTLMTDRVAYLNTRSEFTAVPPTIVAVDASFNSGNSMATITATVNNAVDTSVYLGFRLNINKKFYRVKMYDDGMHNDGAAGDNVFGASVTADEVYSQFYIYAENTTAGIFSPERAEKEYYGLENILTGNDSPKLNSFLQVYPNPANTSLTITSENLLNQSFEISDLQGKNIYQGILSKTQTIDVTNWNSGIYIMKTGNQIQKIAIIK